jgi:hypothetical protein
LASSAVSIQFYNNFLLINYAYTCVNVAGLTIVIRPLSEPASQPEGSGEGDEQPGRPGRRRAADNRAVSKKLLLLAQFFGLQASGSYFCWNCGSSVADPDPGFVIFFKPWFRDRGKISTRSLVLID